MNKKSNAKKEALIKQKAALVEKLLKDGWKFSQAMIEAKLLWDGTETVERLKKKAKEMIAAERIKRIDKLILLVKARKYNFTEGSRQLGLYPEYVEKYATEEQKKILNSYKLDRSERRKKIKPLFKD